MHDLAAPTSTTAPRRLPVYALMAGNTVSLVGSSMTNIALPWFVLQTTGSAAQTGLVAAAKVLPSFLAGVFGGAVVDRLGYKRVSVLSDLISLVGTALVPLLYATTGLAFWQLLVLVFASGLLTIPGLTARRALLPELASRAGMRIERINGAFESAQSLAMLLGPPLAGLLVVVMGAANVLWLDAATFAVSAALVAAVVPGYVAAVVPAVGGYWASLTAGLRFLWRDRVLRTLALGVGLSNFTGNGFYGVVLPVYANDAFGQATVFGAIIACGGAGQFAGALAYGAVGHRLPRRPLWVAAFLVAPVAIWTLAAGLPLPALLVALFVAGVVTGPVNPLMNTVRHERIPAELRGRVFSTFSAIATGSVPLGLLVAGTATEAVGVRLAAVGIACCSQAVGVLMPFLPALREMDQSGPPPNPLPTGRGRTTAT